MSRDNLNNNDWMRELQQSYDNIAALIKRIEHIAHRALHDQKRGRNVVPQLCDIIDGLRLLKQAMEIKN